MDFKRRTKELVNAPINRHQLLGVLKEYKRPNDKISELIKKGDLLSLRRGLYIPGPNLDLPVPEPFLIANHLRGPSYVSMETALGYWGLIPERVYEISSVTVKTAKVYKTPVGRFSYLHVKPPYYSYGIKYVQLRTRQAVLIASPEKALCDKIILSPGVLLRSIAQTEDFLMDDLRITKETLQTLDVKAINSWITDTGKKSSLEMLVKTLDAL